MHGLIASGFVRKGHALQIDAVILMQKIRLQPDGIFSYVELGCKRVLCAKDTLFK